MGHHLKKEYFIVYSHQDWVFVISHEDFLPAGGQSQLVHNFGFM